MSHALTIINCLLYYDQPLVVAAEAFDGSLLVGVSYGDDDPDDLQQFAFVQIDRITQAEFVRGEVDLLTVLTERRSGLVIVGRAYGVPGEMVVGQVHDELPAAALPMPGMFMPASAAPAAHART